MKQRGKTARFIFYFTTEVFSSPWPVTIGRNISKFNNMKYLL